jgi:hypothetical protein
MKLEHHVSVHVRSCSRVKTDVCSLADMLKISTVMSRKVIGKYLADEYVGEEFLSLAVRKRDVLPKF